MAPQVGMGNQMPISNQMPMMESTVGIGSPINSFNSIDRTVGTGSVVSMSPPQPAPSSSPCLSIQCMNGGTCNQISPTAAFCICTSKFFGDRCEIGMYKLFFF